MVINLDAVYMNSNVFITIAKLVILFLYFLLILSKFKIIPSSKIEAIIKLSSFINMSTSIIADTVIHISELNDLIIVITS